jgi:hypothetical protein
VVSSNSHSPVFRVAAGCGQRAMLSHYELSSSELPLLKGFTLSSV